MTHGGKRKGAGRKPDPESRKRPLAIRISPDLAEYLETVEDKTAVIETAVVRSKPFKDWKRKRDGR